MLRESEESRPFPASADGGESAAPGTVPPVTIGLPVYNGENYLRPALESLLAQTFADFEIILSDNGSTDGTEAICREFAARDKRIRYLREPANRGATWNFNRVFRLNRSPWFRWAAHDDVCAPELLERCVAALRARPDAVLAYPRTRIIGPEGEPLGDYGTRLRTDSPDVAVRFHDCICVDHACFPIFGLMRAHLLKRTPLLGAFAGADRNLLAELCLFGPFVEVPEILFLRRDHPGTSTRRFPSAKERMAWFRADARVAVSPTLRRAWGYWDSLNRSPLGPRDRLACLGVLGKWAGERASHWISRRFALASGEMPLPGGSSTAGAHPYVAAQ
jgi:glycosyltransferase involved in cell wall biosynthesis